MGSIVVQKPRAVCIPYPSQGHVTPMLKLSKLLHSRGFYITFVNTEFNHNRLIHSRGPAAVEGLDDFRFETIPDGLPPSDYGATQDVPTLSQSISKNFLAPFRDLLARLTLPPVTCVVADGVMSFALAAAEELGIPAVTFYTTSACGFYSYLHYPQLVERGLTPLRDMADATNGYLDTPIDWVPEMPNVRLRDFPSHLRTTDGDDIMFNFMMDEAQRDLKATAIIINTFDELEHPVLDALAAMGVPPVYTVGPLSLLSENMPESPLAPLRSSLWAEDARCLDWLHGRDRSSVVYVNYGSVTVMSKEQMVEFAWGLADSNHDFLWVIRSDLLKGDAAALPPEFFAATDGRGMIASWCAQEEVLAHPAVGVFLTHSGWNSTLESISAGVPMLCWPFFAEQQTNCRYACNEWGIGMEIDNVVKRGEVEGLIRGVMRGEKGREMKKKALEWREGAIGATAPCGSSYMNFDRVVQVLLHSKKMD